MGPIVATMSRNRERPEVLDHVNDVGVVFETKARAPSSAPGADIRAAPEGLGGPTGHLPSVSGRPPGSRVPRCISPPWPPHGLPTIPQWTGRARHQRFPCGDGASGSKKAAATLSGTPLPSSLIAYRHPRPVGERAHPHLGALRVVPERIVHQVEQDLFHAVVVRPTRRESGPVLKHDSLPVDRGRQATAASITTARSHQSLCSRRIPDSMAEKSRRSSTRRPSRADSRRPGEEPLLGTLRPMSRRAATGSKRSPGWPSTVSAARGSGGTGSPVASPETGAGRPSPGGQWSPPPSPEPAVKSGRRPP